MKHEIKYFDIIGWTTLRLAGPQSICGEEKDGGVSISVTDSKGKERPGGVLPREEVIAIHEFLGRCIAAWAIENRSK